MFVNQKKNESTDSFFYVLGDVFTNSFEGLTNQNDSSICSIKGWRLLNYHVMSSVESNPLSSPYSTSSSSSALAKFHSLSSFLL